MQIGVVFPQLEIGNDPVAIRDYAQAAESLGYDHLLVYDHVLGANRETHEWLRGPYRHPDAFHEPFVLFGYLAGLTQKIELVTGILILPQRQTALVAKQAAEVDVLSKGRLRLGIGIGWNSVEYEALNEDFTNRGRRSEEQIEVMRALWTNDLVTFKGRWHTITDAGINPLPVQRPIPIWFGGYDDRVLRRIGRIGDGWIIAGGGNTPTQMTTSAVERVKGYTQDAGRDPSAMGFEKVIGYGDATVGKGIDTVREWEDAGVTHLSLNTMNSGLATPSDHITAIRRFKEALAEE
ncbi:MAG: LLM class F420-dependent oxidoreductase [Dehalococcoidia bacterium]|nr:LLM class F420-dependent oxidoreductase [Dehalococcoidia bacterium]